MRVLVFWFCVCMACAPGVNTEDIDTVVEECRATVDGFTCEGTDYSGSIDCDAFTDRTCDLTAYFDCLTDNFVCEGSTFDESNWSTCAELSICSGDE